LRIVLSVSIPQNNGAFEKAMGVESDLKPLPFLKVVLNDYNHLTGRL
jgi:hypothetical protein